MQIDIKTLIDNIKITAFDKAVNMVDCQEIINNADMAIYLIDEASKPLQDASNQLELFISKHNAERLKSL